MQVNAKKIVKSVAWSTADTWGRQLTLVIVFVVMVRFLGPEALGLSALAMSGPQFFNTLLQQGLPTALVQRDDIDDSHFDSAFWVTVLAGAFFSLLLFVSSGLFATMMGVRELEALVKWTSLFVVFEAIAIIPLARLLRHLNMRFIAIRSLAASGIGGVVGISMAVSGYGVWSMVGLQLSQAFAGGIILLIGGKWLPRPQLGIDKVRRLLGTGLPVVGSTLAYQITEEIPKLLLGYFVGVAEVGIYSLARRLLEFLIEIFLRPLLRVALPAVSRLKNNKERVESFYNQSILFGHMTLWPACIGLTAISPVFIPFIFGEQWQGGELAVQIMMLAGTLRVLDSISGWTLISLGHPGIVLRLLLFYMVVLTCLLFFVAPYGPEFVIFATFVTHLLYLPILIRYLNKYISVGIAEITKPLPGLILILLVMYVVVACLLSYLSGFFAPPISLTISIFSGIVVYLGGLYFLLPQKSQKIRQLISDLL